MKLDYKIIWVEDKIDTPPFKFLLKEVETHLKSEFFNVILETAEDFDEFKLKYERIETFDLIITDLNLNESHGNEVIDFVRDVKHVLTEIFFYSANSELSYTNLINSSRITFHQLDEPGSYRELGSSIIGLINLTISKFQNIVTMRGMIMHETSTLDLSLLEILKLLISEGDAEKILEVIKNKFVKSTKDKEKKMLKLTDVEEILFEIGSDQRLRAVLRNIDIKGIKDILNLYSSEIGNIRNQFAHATLDEKAHVFRTKNGRVFNSETCKTIRRDIIKHSENINKLNQELSKQS